MANRYPLILTSIAGGDTSNTFSEIKSVDDLRLDGTTLGTGASQTHNPIRVGGTTASSAYPIIKDAAGNTIISSNYTVSAVNHFVWKTAITGGKPYISVDGDTNVTLQLRPKGGGVVEVGDTSSTGILSAAWDGSTSRALTLRSGASTTGSITINPDANANIELATNGTGRVIIGNSSNEAIINSASATTTLTLVSSVDTHTVNIATGVNGSAKTKTLNLGTAGASGSQTTINIGSATSGSHSSIILQSGRGRITTSNTQSLSIATTGASGTGTVATLTFTDQGVAPFEVGQLITVTGVTPTGYNVTATVTACATNSVSYSNATTGAATVQGTITGIVGGIRIAALSQGLASAGNAPIKFTAGTNLTTAEAGAIEYDGTTIFATPNTSFGRASIPTAIYTSGAGTVLSLNAEATLQTLFPAANDAITLPVGTYYLQLSISETRPTGSVTAAQLRVRFAGGGTAGGTFSGMAIGSGTDAGAASIFRLNGVALNVDNVVSASSSVASTVYNTVIQGILRVTTAGTFAPQYNYSANLVSATGAHALAALNHMRITSITTSGSAASTGAWA